MEIHDEQEIAVVRTLRLIREFNASIAQLERLGATGSAKESTRMRDRLIQELNQLTCAIAQPVLTA